MIKLPHGLTETAKILWIIYLSLTVAETALLMLGGMNLFDSLTHTFGTLATGGFSPKNSSVGFYSSGYIHVIITIFMYLAGVNFIMYFRLIRGDTRSIIKNTEFRVYTGIFLVASLLIAIDLHGTVYSSFSESLRYAGFQTASILTTTGYATADFAAWPAMSKITLFTLMFIGGSAGSTGGGMKVVRVVTIIKQGFNEMKYLIYPRGVFKIHLNGRVVKKDVGIRDNRHGFTVYLSADNCNFCGRHRRKHNSDFLLHCVGNSWKYRSRFRYGGPD